MLVKWNPVFLKQSISSQSGASLAVALIATAILSTITFASTSYVSFLKSESHNIRTDFSNSVLKSNLLKTIKSPAAWSYTVADTNNHFIACEQDAANCLAITDQVPLILRNAENQIVVNGTEGTGYNLYGEICTAESCPLLVKTSWKGICDESGTCTQITIKLEVHKKENSGYTSKDEINVLRNYYIGTVAKSLTATVDSALDLSTPTAKVIVILDSSESMIDNFAKVKKGLTNMMTQLSGKDVEVYFFTTASLEPHPHLLSHLNYTNSNHTITLAFNKVSAFDIEKLDDLNYRTHLSMDMSRKISQPIEPSMSSSTITSRLDAILSNYVSAWGTDRESGLCALHRVITDEGPNRIIHPNDLAFFIIVSDENDLMVDPLTRIYRCNKEEKIEQKEITRVNDNLCDISTGTCTHADFLLTFKSTYADIRYTTKENDTYKHYVLVICSPKLDGTVYNPCPYTTSGTFACSPEDLKKINPTGTLQLHSCQITVSLNTNYTTTTIKDSNPENFSTAAAVGCTGGAFSYQTKSYSNIQAYIDQEKPEYKNSSLVLCSYRGYKREEIVGYVHSVTMYTRMNYDTSTSYSLTSAQWDKIKVDMVETLRTKFGQEGYVLRAFIHDSVKDQGLCSLTDGSYGTAYVNFIQSLNSPLSGYESICKEDYGVNFDSLTRTIESKINNTFIFDIASTDQIKEVIITRSGSSFTLQPELYEAVGQKVIFDEGVLQAGDEINLILQESSTSTW